MLAAAITPEPASTGYTPTLQRPVPGLCMVTVQPEGKAPMAFADFERGVRPAPGETFE